MKKITRKEFLEIKTPVLFNKEYSTDICYTFFPKGATNINDFYFVTLVGDKEEKGKRMWESGQRDGCFDDSQMFYVYNNDDIDNLIDVLKELKI